MANCITKLAAWLKLAQADVAATLAGETVYNVGEDLGALIELGRLAQATPQDLRNAERLVAPVVRWDEEQVAALDIAVANAGIAALLRIAQQCDGVVQHLCRLEADRLIFVLVNPAHSSSYGAAVLTYNDTGGYRNPWAALGDLFQQRTESGNETLYLAAATPVSLNDGKPREPTRRQPAAHLEHNTGFLTLKVGERIIAQFFGDYKTTRVRKPFREYSCRSSWSRYGLKATGREIVRLAADVGVPYTEALQTVNDALARLGWPEIQSEETPGDGAMATTIMAQIFEGAVSEWYEPGIYRVSHAPGVDPVAAIKAAAQEFVSTAEGQQYVEADVGLDSFNWGDAALAIPDEILARHGVHGIGVEDLGRSVVIVDHDERIAETR